MSIPVSRRSIFAVAGAALLGCLPFRRADAVEKNKATTGIEIEYEGILIKSGTDSPKSKMIMPGGSITFVAGNTQKTVLRFCPNGDFVFQGNRVVTDIELYKAFRAFFGYIN